MNILSAARRGKAVMMDYGTIDYIRQLAEKTPDAYRYTLACLSRREEILKSVDDMGIQHDSLEAESRIGYANKMENCDAMLEGVFEMEKGILAQGELTKAI